MLRHERRDSNSTIASSEVQYNVGAFNSPNEAFNFSNETPIEAPFDRAKSNPNVKIDGSKVIHVGNVINNNYYSSKSDDFDFKNLSSSNSSENSLNIKNPKEPNEKSKFGSKSRKFLVKRKFIIAVIASVCIVGLCIWLTVFLIKKFNADKTIDNNSIETTKDLYTTRAFTTTPSTISTEDFTTITTDRSTDTPKTTQTSTFEPTTGVTESTTPEGPTLPSTASTTTPQSPVPPVNDIITRDKWSAGELDSSIEKLSLPISRIIVAHTAESSDFCDNLTDCLIKVKAIQTRNSDLLDIPYNYLIGGDGVVYEGRGLFVGEHSANLHGSSYNNIGICVAFMGDYKDSKPSENQIEAFKNFTQNFVKIGDLNENFTIFSQQQLVKVKTDANALEDEMKNFENFYQVGKIYRKDEWDAIEPCRDLSPFPDPIERFFLSETRQGCTTLELCKGYMKNLQQNQISSCERGLGDIRFNFLIGGNEGFVFEGRGFDYESSADEILIAFIGDFRYFAPNSFIVNSTLRFFDDANALGKVSDDYKIYTNFLNDHKFQKIIENWSRYGGSS